MSKDINFEKLPLWRGVKKSAGVFDCLPFSLGWDQRGFITQSTSESIKNKVVHSYADEDYSYGTKPPGLSIWANRLGDAKYDFVQQNCGSIDDKNVLEIGAGTLHIAQRLTNQYNIKKYLVFDPAVKISPERENIQVQSRHFEKGELANGTLDLVLGFSVLEHVLEPMKLLKDLHDILIPSQGKAIFSFPDIEQPFKEGDFNALLHEHLNYFTRSTATSLFSRCGFRVLECESKDGTLWYYLEAQERYPYSDVLPVDGVFEGAGEHFYKNIEQVSHTLKNLQSQGKTVALHGACNGLNNILFLSKIEESKNLLIFDGDKTKAGTYLPASSIPIRFSEDPIYKTADMVFIASLSFYPEIKEFIVAKHGLDPSKIQSL